MPVRLSDYAKQIKNVAIAIDEDTLNIKYRIGEVTPGRIDRIMAMSSDENEEQVSQAEMWQHMLVMIEGWDLQDDAGESLPINAETLAIIPTPILQAVLEAVIEDTRPTKKTGRRSRGG